MQIQITYGRKGYWYESMKDSIFDVLKREPGWYTVRATVGGTTGILSGYVVENDCVVFESEENKLESAIERISKLEETLSGLIHQKAAEVNKSSPRTPDESTPVDTLVKARNTTAEPWAVKYFAGIRGNRFYCFSNGLTSRTTSNGSGWLYCEVIEETIEEKRAKIFHKFVPEAYKWHAVDSSGYAFYYRDKPSLGINNWYVDTVNYIRSGFADSADWQNSLIGRD